jgi:hypothetical protein
MPLLTLETLLVTEKATLSFERVDGGKIRVKASSWDDAKVILPDQVLEVRSIDAGCGLRGRTGSRTRAISRRRLSTRKSFTARTMVRPNDTRRATMATRVSVTP